MSTNTGKRLPFKIDRNDGRTLLDQVSDGLRTAIVGGYYRPGDPLPSSRLLAPMLGVSKIVTEAALKRLAADGLVESRPRRGTFVRDTNEKRWRGRVVFIYDAGDTGYFQTTLAERVRVRLNAEGYLFTHSSVDRRPDGTTDFSLLDAALARSTDLALVLFDRDDVCRRLAKRGVPFAAAVRRAPPPGAVGVTTISHKAAFRAFAAWCRAEGIREVVQLSWFRAAPDATPELAATGVKCRRRVVAPDFSGGRLIGIEEAGFREFRRLVEAGRIAGGPLYFFTDDYLLRGAIQAFVGTGVKFPGDVRVATIVNAGSGPYIARSLPRIVVDAEAIGDAIADSALSFLAGGPYAGNEVGGIKWVDPEDRGTQRDATFPDRFSLQPLTKGARTNA